MEESQQQALAAESKRSLCQAELLRVLPILAGMDAIGCRPDEASPDPTMVEHTFDILALIGAHQATGRGVFADPRFNHAAPYIAMLNAPVIEAAHAGAGNLDGLADQSTMVQVIQTLADKVRTYETSKGKLFSVVGMGLASSLRETNGPKYSTAKRYENIVTEFATLVGDKPVGEYGRVDLQAYANALAWLPPDATRQKDFRYEDVKRLVEENRATGGRGLAKKSIREGRLAYVKAIIKMGCQDAQIPNPVAGTRIKIPDRAAPPQKRMPPSAAGFEPILRAGIESGNLFDAVLPPLAYLTGRRTGLLSCLFREDFEFLDGTWICHLRSHTQKDGEWFRISYKTDKSLEPLIVPNLLVECGFVDWAVSASGPVFAELFRCKDPADAGQKRLARLIRGALPAGQRRWVPHGLRHGKINVDRDNDVSASLTRKAVGHEAIDEHDRYGSLTAAQARRIANGPVPPSVDWTLLQKIDFEAFSKRKHRQC